MTEFAPVQQSAHAEIFRPWDTASERKLRSRILNCQRVATQRIKATGSDDARTLYWVALDASSRSAFASASPEHLLDVIHALSRLFVVAGQFERWEAGGGH